jgi:hypothetical protein
MIKENPVLLNTQTPIMQLLKKIMASTHIFPQSYKINPIRYDPTPIAEGTFGKVYKGRDLDVCVSMITRPGDVSVRFKLHVMGVALNAICRVFLNASPFGLTRHTRTTYPSMECSMKM